MKILKALAWVFIVATLVGGIMGLSGIETVTPYLPTLAVIMASLSVLHLALLNRGKQQPSKQ